ncbi:FAD-dependent oxidoreductase, partial [filamentous cyanobacterium CCP5]
MESFDWIVVGNGLAGAALGYELAKQGLSVIVLEQALEPESATRYSYGGIPYWSGTTPLTTQINAEGIAKHRQLSAELEADTAFRDIDLILTIPAAADADAIAARYDKFAIAPQRLSAAEAVEREPLLSPEAIAGALLFPHAHVAPRALVAAYNQAM